MFHLDPRHNTKKTLNLNKHLQRDFRPFISVKPDADFAYAYVKLLAPSKGEKLLGQNPLFTIN